MHSPHTEAIRIGLVQTGWTGDRTTNLDRALKLVAEAAATGAQLVCLPELFAGPYPCQSEDHDRFAEAEPIPGPTCDRLAEAARRLGVVIVGSVFERRAPGLFHNTAVVFENDGSMLGMYRKTHIPDDPHYYEKFYFTPGDLGLPVFRTSVGKIGVAVCWDQWFPEVARLLALAGAEIICYPTAIGWLHEEKKDWGKSQWQAWETMMRSHAIANGLFVVAVNRTGVEDEIEFWGRSFCVDPYGEMLVRADADARDGIYLASCNRSLIETARTHWPFLRDRRIDLYGNLTRRFLD